MGADNSVVLMKEGAINTILHNNMLYIYIPLFKTVYYLDVLHNYILYNNHI